MWIRDVESTLSGASHVRRDAGEFLEAMGVSNQLDDALVVLSELATNAVQHGRPPVTASLEVEDGRVHVEMSDASAEPPQVQPVDATRVGGNGMIMVAALARWGVRRHPGDGKTVWADIAP